MSDTATTPATTTPATTPATAATTPPPDFGALVAAYLLAWNATDPRARRTAIERAFAVDARYADPLADVTGHDGLDAVIAGAQEQFPGFVFTGHGTVDGHHDQVRFSWGLGPVGAEPLVVGSDVAVVDDDGRIRLVLGFLDKVPA